MPNGSSSWNNSHMSLSTNKERLKLWLMPFLEGDLYMNDDDFKEAYDSCANSANEGFFTHKGFLFKEKHLCMLKSSIQEMLLKKAHEGGLMEKNHMRPSMNNDVHHACERCLVCKASSNGLYTPPPPPPPPLPILATPWVDISMSFMLELPRSRGDTDFIFMIMDKFLKMGYLILCHKSDDACHVTNLFFKEVVRLYGLLKSIVLDRNPEFFSHF
ncbi:Tf2-9, partial [Mucuna pruriens]